jgi:hypothetical protein
MAAARSENQRECPGPRSAEARNADQQLTSRVAAALTATSSKPSVRTRPRTRETVSRAMRQALRTSAHPLASAAGLIGEGSRAPTILLHPPAGAIVRRALCADAGDRTRSCGDAPSRVSRCRRSRCLAPSPPATPLSPISRPASSVAARATAHRPAFPRKEEPVLARFWLIPTTRLDETWNYGETDRELLLRPEAEVVLVARAGRLCWPIADLCD